MPGLADCLDFFVRTLDFFISPCTGIGFLVRFLCFGDPKFDSCLPNFLLKPRNTIDGIYFATFLVSLDNYSELMVTSASASLQEKEDPPVSRQDKVLKDNINMCVIAYLKGSSGRVGLSHQSTNIRYDPFLFQLYNLKIWFQIS